MEKSKSSLSSSSMLCVRQMVLRVGFKFKLATARVRTPRPSRLLMALLAGCGVQAAFALPQGGQVASGGVTIGTPANNSLNITQTTNQGVINWQSFNVASGEKVTFQQPGATSSTLNRVVGSDPTAIFGQINANGQVFLINNSGVLFAPGAQVNAAGLVASTLQLSDSDYLAGHYVLNGAGGSVSNQGVIKAGFVALAGSQVSNTGTIIANGGTAALAAGDRVTLNLIGSDLVSMSVDAPTAAAQVRAGGVVQADGGQVLISAKAADAMLGTVVNVDGIVQARSIGSRNGVISLDGGNSGVVSVSGTLDASGKGAGETGGGVRITGANVGLFDHAAVDASGDAGGGVVRIGGDWHGAGADGDANASQAYVGSNATIAANAITAGKGGNVVVWSDDHTQFFGSIDARGGAAGGDGGNVETSGHALHVNGKVDASSAAGHGGNWLLDPIDVNITHTGTTDIIPSGGVWRSSSGNSTIVDSDLGAALMSGTNVQVQTNNTTPGNGDITVTGQVVAALTGSQSATLSLEAIRNITFTGGSISSADGTALTVNLNAGTNNSHVSPGSNTSTITMDAASSINLGTSGASALTATAKGNIQLGGLTVGSGGVQVTSNGGAVTQSSALTVNGTLTTNTANGNVTLDTAGNGIGTYAGDAGTGAVSIHNGSTLTLGDITASSLGVDTTANNSDVAHAGGTDLNVSGGVTINAGTGAITAGSTTSAIGHIGTTGHATDLSAGTLALDNVSATTLTTHTGTTGSVTTTGGATITAASTDLHAGTGGVTLLDGNTIGSYGANTTGSASFTNNAGITLGNVTAASLTVDTSGGNGTVGQAASTDLQITNGATILAGSGDIAVGSTASTIGHLFSAGHATSLTAASLVLDNISATTLTTNTGATGSVSQRTGSAIHATTSATLNAGSGGVALSGITAPALTVDTHANNGAVTQVAGTDLSVSGGLTIDAGSASVTAGSTASTIGHVASSGGATTLKASTLVLDTIDASTLTTATGAAGSVTQSGGGTITATSTDLHAGTGGVTLVNGDSIGTYGVSTTGAASITNSGGVNLGNVTATGLTVDTSAGNGSVSQAASTGLSISGGLTITAGTGGVSAGSTSSTIGHVASSGGATTLKGTSLALDDITATSLSTATGAAGSVTQTGGHTITATTTDLHAGTGGVTLVNGNTIGTYGANTTGSASFTNNGGVNVGNVTAASLVVDTSAGNGVISHAAGTGLAITNGATFTAGSGSITAGSATSTIGHVASSGGATTLTASSLVLDNITATSLTTATGVTGNVTQTGGDAITAASTTFGAGTGGATIGNAGNAITSWGANTTGTASFTSTGAVALGPVSANSLSVHAGGAITQSSGTVAVGSTSSLDAAGADITLGAIGNTFGGLVSVNHAGTATIGDTGVLGVHLANTTNGALTSTGALTVDGATTGTLSASGNGVALGSGSGALHVGSTLTASSGSADITQGNTLTVGSTSSLNAGSHNVALANGANTFGGTVTATGTSVSIAATGPLDANVTLTGGTGDLTLASTGALSGPTAVATTGNISLTTGGALTTAGALSGHDVSLTGTSVSVGNDVTASHDLALHATGGAISQTAGTVAAAGATSLTAAGAGNTITLTGASNSLVGAVTVSGSTVNVTDASALTISGTTSADLTATGSGITFGAGATAVGGALVANAGAGAIAQSGAVSVAGTSTLNGGTVTLANASNAFTGQVSATASAINIGAAGNLAVTPNMPVGTGDLTLAAYGSSATLTIPGGAISTSGDVSLTAGGGLSTSGDISARNVTLGGGALTIGNHINATGTFNATSTSTITETGSGDIHAAGLATLDAGANAITLAAATNNFGAVTATGGAVTIVDADAMSVHLASATSANLTATAGVLGVDGTTSAGDLTIAGQGIVFGGGSTSVHGALTANSGAGTLAQTGNVAVTGTTTLDAGSAAITLANPGNDFAGAVTAHGGAIALTDINALTAHVTGSGDAALVAGGLLSVDGSSTNMAASGNGIVFGATSTGALQADGGTGTIIQTGALTLSNNVALTATGHDITLTNAANNLGSNASTFAGANVALTSTGALSAGGTATGNLALNGTAVTLGASTVGGTLVVTGHGGIAGANPVVVGGASTLDAGSAGITLSSAGNHFGGLVTATGGAVTLADSGALSTHLAAASSATLNAGGAVTVDGATTGNLSAAGSSVSLGATTVGGTLTATASTGAIAQTGAVAVTGASTLDATAGAVTLANPANDFGGVVTASGSSVSLADANALTAHVNSSGNATLGAGGALSVDGTVGGALGATSTGPITQTAALTVGGPSVLDAGTAAITLVTTGNDFGGAVTAAGSTVSLADANALAAHVTSSAGTTLNAGGALAVDGTVGGSLAAVGNGAMTQSAALTVGGTSTLNAGTGAITLANAGNDFTGAVSATGGAISLTDTNALNAHLGGASSATLNAGGALAVDGNTSGALTANGNGLVLGATTVGGNLAASSGTGSITQSGTLAVTGTSTLDGGGHAVTLANVANDFGGAVTATGGAVTLSDANALTAHLTATSATLVAGSQLIADGATSGTVTVTAASADVEQAGALKVSLNNVGSAVVKSGAALQVDGNSTGNLTATGSAVTLGGSTLAVGGNLAATSTAGDITQAGTLSVTGTSTLAAGSGNVTLADTANALGGAVTASGANVTLADASALTAHLAANGSATLTSASGLTVDGSAGALNATGTSVAFGAAGTTVNGALTTNGGGVSQSGALAVSGLSTFNAGTGDILLASPGTNLQGAITATGHTISLSDAHAIDASVTATGDVTLASTGDVTTKGTFNGGLTISGAKVTLDQGTLATPMAIGGKLDVTSTGNTSLSYVTAKSVQVSAGGALSLDGTLKSTGGDVTLKANTIQGVNKLGAIDAAAGTTVSLDTAGGGNVGKVTPTLGLLDADAIISLLGASGQSGLIVKFSAGSSAWFRVSSQQQTALLQPQSTISSQTFFCDMATCVNVLGQTTSIADSVIANILTAASQDAADAAFGTENLDFAIRKGYVTTIGRVPPGIDEIAGDLGATPCDSRVTSPTAIAADKACSAGK
ncbi:MAG: filamentous hemagglutinin N-terminal domain-containing protein [Burkholderiales bacterium]|nr:filamentous hemagglutinin N-terminal domain-containing protein [Burkholderiales bacterium]